MLKKENKRQQFCFCCHMLSNNCQAVQYLYRSGLYYSRLYYWAKYHLEGEFILLCFSRPEFYFHEEQIFKGTYRDHRVTGTLNFHKTRDFFHFGNGIRCVNLTLKGIEKIWPLLITKRHGASNVWTKSPVIFFQTDNQPTPSVPNVNRDHNIGVHIHCRCSDWWLYK